MTSPAHTFAFVTGVEQYAATAKNGVKMDLWGPACDAMRFVVWLLQRGVPAGQIYLFANSRPENEALIQAIAAQHASAPDVWVARKEPTHDALHVFASRDLKKLGFGMPDPTLFVFWGGHGVAVSDGVRFLLPSDFEKDSRWAIQAEWLLKELRDANRLARQVAFIDACADPLETKGITEGLKAAGTVAAMPQSNAGVRQTAFYSVTEGEKARENKTERTGFFSDVLLKELAALPKDLGWPPDLSSVFDRLNAHFDARNQGTDPAKHQQPVLVEVRVNGGLRWLSMGKEKPLDLVAACQQVGLSLQQLQTLIQSASLCGNLEDAAIRDRLFGRHGGPKADAAKFWGARPSRASTEHDLANLLFLCLRQAALPALHESIREVSNAPLEVQHFEWEWNRVDRVMRVGKIVREAQLSPHQMRLAARAVLRASSALREDDDVGEILDELTKPRKPELLAEFLLRLASEYSPANRKNLLAWVRSEIGNQGRELLRGIRTKQRLGLLLSVRTEPSPQGDMPAGLQAWLRLSSETLVPFCPEEGSAGEEIPVAGFDELEAAIVRVYRAAWEKELSHVGSPYLELALPDTLMSRPFDLLDTDQTLGRKLGFDQPVLLRWRERVRARGTAPARLWAEWAAEVSSRATKPCPLIVGDTADWQAVEAGVKNKPDLVITWLPAQGQGGNLRQLLQSGLPYGMLVRKPFQMENDCRECLKDAIEVNQLSDLPVHLLKFRQARMSTLRYLANDPAPRAERDVALIWDDPALTWPGGDEEDEWDEA